MTGYNMEILAVQQEFLNKQEQTHDKLRRLEAMIVVAEKMVERLVLYKKQKKDRNWKYESEFVNSFAEDVNDPPIDVRSWEPKGIPTASESAGLGNVKQWRLESLESEESKESLSWIEDCYDTCPTYDENPIKEASAIIRYSQLQDKVPARVCSYCFSTESREHYCEEYHNLRVVAEVPTTSGTTTGSVVHEKANRISISQEQEGWCTHGFMDDQLGSWKQNNSFAEEALIFNSPVLESEMLQDDELWYKEPPVYDEVPGAPSHNSDNKLNMAALSYEISEVLNRLSDREIPQPNIEGVELSRKTSEDNLKLNADSKLDNLLKKINLDKSGECKTSVENKWRAKPASGRDEMKVQDCNRNINSGVQLPGLCAGSGTMEKRDGAGKKIKHLPLNDENIPEPLDGQVHWFDCKGGAEMNSLDKGHVLKIQLQGTETNDCKVVEMIQHLRKDIDQGIQITKHHRGLGECPFHWWLLVKKKKHKWAAPFTPVVTVSIKAACYYNKPTAWLFASHIYSVLVQRGLCLNACFELVGSNAIMPFQIRVFDPGGFELQSSMRTWMNFKGGEYVRMRGL